MSFSIRIIMYVSSVYDELSFTKCLPIYVKYLFYCRLCLETSVSQRSLIRLVISLRLLKEHHFISRPKSLLVNNTHLKVICGWLDVYFMKCALFEGRFKGKICL